MTTLPQDAKNIAGLEQFGVDKKGFNVIFGFMIEGENPVTLQTNYKALAECITYLQTLAKEAQKRRFLADIASQDTEAREVRPTLVRQLDFELEVNGDSALLVFTTQDGLRNELQVPYDILQRMRDQLPELLVDIDKRRSMPQHSQ